MAPPEVVPMNDDDYVTLAYCREMHGMNRTWILWLAGAFVTLMGGVLCAAGLAYAAQDNAADAQRAVEATERVTAEYRRNIEKILTQLAVSQSEIKGELRNEIREVKEGQAQQLAILLKISKEP